MWRGCLQFLPWWWRRRVRPSLASAAGRLQGLSMDGRCPTRAEVDGCPRENPGQRRRVRARSRAGDPMAVPAPRPPQGDPAMDSCGSSGLRGLWSLCEAGVAGFCFQLLGATRHSGRA
mmetsp:Transcript_36953/g.50561  ORF Transcript_36953/g.50561 Transcript_36953/m.50561 type:complete len:118 (-) Transcript_36953:387-740(-)